MRTRNDIKAWMEQMITAVAAKTGTIHSKIHLGETGSKYTSAIRDFESFARPLWGIFALLKNNEKDGHLDFYIQGIKEGINPLVEGYWGEPGNRNQMLVEMAVFGFGLVFCREKLLDYFSVSEKKSLELWMNKALVCEFPENNWQFFCVFINMGLKLNGMLYQPQRLAESLAKIDSFYLGNGWYTDGNTKQRDYYVSFAFHFYGILYSMLVPEEEGRIYRDRASLFAEDFIYWFDAQGRGLPFGRSLTYRFAQVAFWSAMAFAGIGPFPLGVLKGLIFRNFRWWQSQPVYSTDGLLSIGYAYPNLILSEDYNAPGSPLWAFKSFIVLMLPQEHVFWSIPELELPERSVKRVQSHAGFICMGGGKSGHYYALSSGQYAGFPLLHSREKYAKFCYSTHFGFNISRDQNGLHNTAVDSMLVLGIPGTDQYFSRGDSVRHEVHETYLYSRWQYGGLAEIDTWLVPVSDICHVRVHKIKANCTLEAHEGAFPLEDLREDNHISKDRFGTLIRNQRGTNGIVDLLHTRETEIITQNPNSNLYTPEKTLVPSLKQTIKPGITLLACAIIAAEQELGTATIQSAVPEVNCNGTRMLIQTSQGDEIVFALV